MLLSPVQEKFVLHWGEMGTCWGIPRTVAQIHALLYIAGRPMNAEEITETLGVARSNVSMSIKQLREWRVIRTSPVRGDRREHFETGRDVWDMFQVILDERKRREIDPTVELLRDCLAEAEASGKENDEVRARLEELLGFFNTMTTWYEQVSRLPQSVLRKFIKLGGRVGDWVKQTP